MSRKETAHAGTQAPSAAAGDVVASVRDLTVAFDIARGRVQALRSLSLDIRAGEILAVVGESGSGKTVLGASILGLIEKGRGTEMSGAVVVDGVDMIHGPERQRSALRRHSLGAVFQNPLSSLDPTMRIGRQLTERGISVERAVEKLTDAGVPEPERRARQFPHELSGGLQQRVMIAMALGAQPPGDAATAGKDTATAEKDDRAQGRVDMLSTELGVPRLIVADEPTTALDVSVQAQIVLLFDRIRREHGCAIMLITHDLGVAASVADRVAVVYAGRICEIGPAADVLTRPSHPYTRALLATRLSAEVDRDVPLRPIPGLPPDPARPEPGCGFAPRCLNARENCRREQPPVTARPSGDGQGLVACFYPHDTPTRDPEQALAPATLATPAGREPALELDGLRKSFAISGGRLGLERVRVHAVDGLSLTVPAGGATALVGESGCGKTTTLRMACGLITPDEGRVRWSSDSGRPQLIFQDAGSSLTPWCSIGSMIEEQLAARGVPRRRRRADSLELLDLVGLDTRVADARPASLSGGQRQRAAIARALAVNPGVLICDEPVSALDASLALRVLELLQRLRADMGMALLIVTHDLGVAQHIADDIAVMYRGAIVEQGPVDSLFQQPAHPYTQGLLAAIPSIEPGRLSPQLQGEPPSPVGPRIGCSFASRCPYAQDRCRSEAPLLGVVGGHRSSACHFSGALLAGTLQPADRPPFPTVS